MHLLLENKHEEIGRLCRQYNVLRLAVFGSILRADFTEDSDVDFLVEFASPSVDSFDRYFALKEGLEALLGRGVDLVVTDAIRNPIFRTEVLRTQLPLYAA